MKSPLAIERHVAILKARENRGPQLLPALATALNADYLIWGSLTQVQGNLELKTAVYGKTRGQDIVNDMVRTSSQLPVTEMTAQLASSLGQKLQIQKVDNRLALTLGSLKPGTPAQQRFMNPVSQTKPVARIFSPASSPWRKHLLTRREARRPSHCSHRPGAV